ncbi:hypothetical protein QO010_001003 [Caulobacter ginsengisoli]|uniref:Uncharacterized protein n=1 Tax=Caulobacter ginsengisoli TaxID=400775 RepID=A0ABU0IML2_9CAUL|nr:hypothetical protein [Caulobacter ginsengisoli]MDQ0463255.1 hypothetical protein [Caulobacter ginsengisoli]
MLSLVTLSAALMTLVAPPASGRMHDVSGNPGVISAWDDGECQSGFKLKLGEAKALGWTINWSKVESITVETDSSFENDPAADLYKVRTSLVVKGAGAFQADLGSRKVEADSFEYFLETSQQAKSLQNIWTRRAASCLLN